MKGHGYSYEKEAKLTSCSELCILLLQTYLCVTVGNPMDVQLHQIGLICLCIEIGGCRF